MRITTVTVRARMESAGEVPQKKCGSPTEFITTIPNDKFVPEFPKEYFLAVAESIPVEKFGDELNALRAVVCEAIFNPELYKTQLNQAEGQDLVTTSANNYYEGVTQAEVEEFYRSMADPADPEPVSYGLNSKLVKDEDGTIASGCGK